MKKKLLIKQLVKCTLQFVCFSHSGLSPVPVPLHSIHKPSLCSSSVPSTWQLYIQHRFPHIITLPLLLPQPCLSNCLT